MQLHSTLGHPSKNYGCNAVCTSMSMMSENMLPLHVKWMLQNTSMCYVAGQKAHRRQLVDGNNNYADDDTKCVLFHCGNWAKSFCLISASKHSTHFRNEQETENTLRCIGWLDARYAADHGRISTGWLQRNSLKHTLARANPTNDALQYLGNRAVIKINNSVGLMNHVCRNGFLLNTMWGWMPAKLPGILKEALKIIWDGKLTNINSDDRRISYK